MANEMLGFDVRALTHRAFIRTRRHDYKLGDSRLMVEKMDDCGEMCVWRRKKKRRRTKRRD